MTYEHILVLTHSSQVFYGTLLYIDNVRKGVYPQSDESLAIVDIDASKGIIDLWVHFLMR